MQVVNNFRRIISIVETDNWRAVYMTPNGSVDCGPIDAIGVVEIDTKEPSTEIVFLEYSHGGTWEICQETRSFLGVIRKNEYPEVVFKFQIEEFKKQKGI